MRLFFGGTFDPVHLGHVQGALAAAAAFDVEQVDMVLSARPSHRNEPGATIEQRLDMLRIACQADERLVANAIEARRERPSYTVETLEELRREFPHASLGWVVGADAYHYLPTWHRWREVFDLAHLVVLQRVGHEQPPERHAQALQHLEEERMSVITPTHRAGSLLPVRVSLPDISATRVRQRVRQGLPVAHLLPNGVADYLYSRGIYKEEPNQSAT